MTDLTGQSAGVEARPSGVWTVLIGLMLGMMLAAVSQTIVAPALPRIVAELGGMEHYSWIAVSAMLASTVVVPIVGKLSDLYGRKSFFVGGIVCFMLGSVISGLAPDFTTLVLARVLQGFGMGTMMPLSQTIIGDIIAPRDRGKYQGLMGGIFGLASVAGPLVGGYITDNFSWRWLFFANLPFGILALGFIVPFMHLPVVKRPHSIDYWGMATLSAGLTSALLATAWGGTQFPWGSVEIVGLYGVALLSLAAFAFIETRVPEPVMPFRLWKNSIFTLSNIANMAVAMGMFGAIFYLPVFLQAVLGHNATASGALLIPMSLAMIGMSILSGLVISWTGRYKPVTILGLLLMGAGYYLLTLLGTGTTNQDLLVNMVVLGVGVGASMQTYTLIVQNSVSRQDLGIATATTQLFRSIGSTLGIAVFGTIMTQGMATEIAARMPAQAAGTVASQSGGSSIGSLLSPAALASLPPASVEAIREGASAALHTVFVSGLPFVAVALLASIFIKEVPLRRKAHAHAADDGDRGLAPVRQTVPERTTPARPPW